MNLMIDPALTAQENFHKVVSHAFSTYIPIDSYTVYRFYSVTPSIQNEQANTRALIRGAIGSQISGETNVYYRRQSLAGNQPRAGTRVFIDNSVTTHAAVISRIMQHYKLIESEVTVTLPRRVPYGGDHQTYVLTPKNDSVLYLGSPLSVEVINTSPFQAVDPSALFGSSIGTSGERLVYALAPLTTAHRTLDGERASFNKLLDSTNDTQSFKFRISDFVLSNIRQEGNYTYIDFDPGSTAKTLTGGTFRMTRITLANWWSCPTSYQAYNGIDFFIQGLLYNNIPLQKVSLSSFGLTGVYRRANYTVASDSLLFIPNSSYLYVYANISN